MAIKALQSMGEFGQIILSHSLSQSTLEGTRNLELNLINNTNKKDNHIDKAVDVVLRNSVAQLGLQEKIKQRIERGER